MARHIALGLLVLVAGAAALAIHTWRDVHAHAQRERALSIPVNDAIAPIEAGVWPACVNRVDVYGCRRSARPSPEATASVDPVILDPAPDAQRVGRGSDRRTGR